MRRLVLIALAAMAAFSSLTAAADPIRGAGSTFAAPAIARWAEIYRSARVDGGDFVSTDWTVDYELVGSLAGIMRLDQPELDFAATDTPLPPEELAKRGYQQFPIVMGGVAVVANLPGLPAGRLRLNGAVLAGIYTGRISAWSDPAIRALNPELPLPEIPIAVVHRKDGSGTTFAFTQYLSAVDQEWRSRYGSDTLINWPVGSGAEGTQGLLASVRATAGAIGYLEFGQVVRAGLPFAAIENRAGRFVTPEPAGVLAAANAVDWAAAKDFNVSLTDLPGEATYPIAAATFAVVPVRNRARARILRVHDLFRLAFEQGAAQASALGYVPLSEALVALVKAQWSARAGG